MPGATHEVGCADRLEVLGPRPVCPGPVCNSLRRLLILAWTVLRWLAIHTKSAARTNCRYSVIAQVVLRCLVYVAVAASAAKWRLPVVALVMLRSVALCTVSDARSSSVLTLLVLWRLVPLASAAARARWRLPVLDSASCSRCRP